MSRRFDQVLIPTTQTGVVGMNIKASVLISRLCCGLKPIRPRYLNNWLDAPCLSSGNVDADL